MRNYTLNSLLGLINGFGFTFIGVGLALATGADVNLLLAGRFIIFGLLALLAAFLLGLIDAIATDKVNAVKAKTFTVDRATKAAKRRVGKRGKK